MRTSRRYKRSVCFLPVLLCLLYPVASQDQSIATFYGAYQRVKPTDSDTELNLLLNFKTSAQTGLILTARLDHSEGGNAGYFAVGIQQGQLVSEISEDATLSLLPLGVQLVGNVWHRLSVHLLSTNISVGLTGGETATSLSHSLSSELTVRDVFVGGANNFFARAFMTLSITEYFVGCLANGTYNGREIDFAPKIEGYGLEYGCCPEAEQVIWCFDTGQQHFEFSTRLLHEHFSNDYLRISFRIRATGDGMIFYSHVADDVVSAIAIELYSGYLQVSLMHDSIQFHTVNCSDSLISDGWWHEAEITIRLNSLHCLVDGMESRLDDISLGSLPVLPTSEPGYSIGAAAVPTPNSALLLFQGHLMTYPNHGMFPSFNGCLQNFQLNGLDLAPTSLGLNSPSLSRACPSYATPEPSTPCQLLQQELSVVQTQQISVETGGVSLNESDHKVLTAANFILRIPSDIIRQDVRDAIADSIQFNVIRPPSHGQFFNVQDKFKPIFHFTYLGIVKGEISYRHNGDESESDMASMQVQSNCSSDLSRDIKINFAITPVNDPPMVTQQSPISIAVGTRRVITKEIITVEDAEASSQIDISFRVVNITVSGCGLCPQSGAGRIEQTAQPGFKYIDFNQEDINQGEIAFQHFAKFGTNPVTIHLRVSDRSAAGIEVNVSVNPYVGHLNLTRNRPLFVVQGRCALIEPQHLNAVTDFDDQNPIVRYSVTTVPAHGHLEIQSQGYWVPLQGSGSDLDGFTQSDIDSGLVHYCHDDNALSDDSFNFQLHSTDLRADNSTFTIRVVPYEDLQLPRVTLEVSPLPVLEGGVVSVTNETLRVAFARSVSVPWSGEEIRVEELGIEFQVERPPEFGALLVEGESSLQFSLNQVLEGAVSYRHASSEYHQDYLTLSVEATNTPNLPIKTPLLPSPTNVSINIHPVNSHSPTVITAQLSPGEGRFVIVNSSMFNIIDLDLPQQTISITLTNQDVGYGYFAFNNNTAVAVEQFTMADVYGQRILFKHQIDLSRPLNYTMTFEASDGERKTSGDIYIQAVPLTINTDTVQTDSCIAELDAVQPSLLAPIAPFPLYNIEILDSHGNDINRLQDMQLYVSAVPRYGHLLHDNQPASVFTLNDLEQGWVTYRFSNRSKFTREDYFSLVIMYGHANSSSPIPFKICINPVPIPSLETIEVLSLAAGSVVVIDNTTLKAVDSRGRDGDLVVYHIVHDPQLGRVMDMSNVPRNTFTQAEIDQGEILYRPINNSSQTLKDFFTFKLCTEYLCTDEYNMTVTFYVTELTVFSNGVTVEEGGEKIITELNLDAIAPVGFNIQLHMTTFPTHGYIKVDAGRIYKNPPFFEMNLIYTRSVRYVHDGSETLHDHFAFDITGRNTNNEEQMSVSDVLNINIRPVNNKKPRLVYKDVFMIARSTKNITSADVEAYDADSDANSSALLYTLALPHTQPKRGIIHYTHDPNPNQTLTRWYESDIRAGRIAYTHTDTQVSDDVVIINLYDRDQESTDYIHFHIRKIQLERADLSDDIYTVDEGGRGTSNITQEYLRYVSQGDSRLTDIDYIYNITAGPLHGSLTLRGSPATSFTQADLLSPGLVYQHDHSNTISDDFSFNVTIPRYNATKTDFFRIRIKPIDDDPPSMTFLHNPLFVLEGSTLKISREDIMVYDYDTDMNSESETSQIKFHVITVPQHGRVLRKRFGSHDIFRATEEFNLYEVNHLLVAYEHVEINEFSTNWSDWFLVNLTDGINTHREPYNFTFVILPDIVEVEYMELEVVEGSSVVLPSNLIQAAHPFLKTQVGSINITIPPRDGYLINTATGERNITLFNTSDLSLGHIKYQHSGAENENDQFMFNYQAHQPVVLSDGITEAGEFPHGFTRISEIETLHINVEPVNDRSPIISTTRDGPLLMWASDCVLLTETDLNAIDADTVPEKLVYTFTFNFDAYIANTTDRTHIDSFTQQDIYSGSVKLFHRGGTSGVMEYNVTDGDFRNSSQLYIETQQLEIVVLHLTSVRVGLNGMTPITSDILNCVTSNNINSSLPFCRTSAAPMGVEYRFESQYGRIIVKDLPHTDVFTQGDVDAGRVFYQHTRPELWESHDTVRLLANASLAEPRVISLSITIDLPSEPNSPLAVHRPLVVEERGVACLNESILDARNIQYAAWKTTVQQNIDDFTILFYFYITERSHGEIWINGTSQGRQRTTTFTQSQVAQGLVCYKNLGDESPSDPLLFSVSVTDEGNYERQLVENLTLNISVILINDERPEVKNSSQRMVVVQGFSARLTGEYLVVTDEDNPPADLIFTVLEMSSNGELWLEQQKLDQNDTFSQTDINAERLQFKALDLGEWNLHLFFTDGKFNGTTIFTVEVIEHVVELVDARVIHYPQNKKGTYLTKNDIITSTNGDPQETKFKILEGPHNGILEGINQREKSFTQVDLEAGVVHYTPRDFNSHTDSFRLAISNRQARISQHDITIHVRVEVWGQVSQGTELNFEGDETSLPLPTSILKLNDLQRALQRPPLVRIIQHPRWGFLEEKVSDSVRSRRSSQKHFSFFYDYLSYGWVYYTWSYSNSSWSRQDVVNDSFTILVEGYHSNSGESIQPGEATIVLRVHPPLSDMVASPTSPASSPSDPSEIVHPTLPDDPSSDGFPSYALIPILGVFGILIVIIIVVVIFCLTQQGRIRKKWQPKIPPSPWGGRGHHTANQAAPNIYDFEPSSQREAMANLTEMADRSSNYTEIHSPPSHSPLSRYSPSAAHPVPIYTPSQASQSFHLHHVPRPRSRRSNVSVSYSHRPLSEVTDEPSNHLPFSPTSPLAAPIPIKPMSHSPHMMYEEGESGYLSTPTNSINVEEPVRLTLARREEALLVTPKVEVEEGEEAKGGGEEEGEREEDEKRGKEKVEETTLTEDGREEEREEQGNNGSQPRGLSPSSLPKLDLWLESQSSLHDTPSPQKEKTLPSSNGAHAVSTPPSEPEVPLVSVTSAASAASANDSAEPEDSSSDLHSLFRTHDPLLKRQEYWV